MQNEVTTTFETAVKLKEAGFPQPQPQAGQFWYLPFMGVVGGRHLPYLVNYVSGDMVYFSGVGIPVEYKTHLGAGLAPNAFIGITKYFAPQAHDILRELAVLVKNTQTVQVEVSGYGCEQPETRVWLFGSLQNTIESDWHNNPHEAAAIAWLAQKGGKK